MSNAEPALESRPYGDTVDYLVSIIVPCYNAESKIGRCLESLDNVDFPAGDFEVLFVDDQSTDATAEILRRFCRTRTGWRVIELDGNSGSPSRPRNVGIANARGEYVFFLDADDEVLPTAIQDQYLYATAGNIDVVRSSLIVAETGRKPVTTNRLPDVTGEETKIAMIEKIVALQSTTNSTLIRRSLLKDCAIEWPEHLHMGEDTVFLIEVLSKASRVGYVDAPGIVYNKFVSHTRSATQIYGARELHSHIEVWSFAEKELEVHGLSYIGIRGQVALKVAVEALHTFNTGDIGADDLHMFAQFLNRHWPKIEQMEFSERVRGTLELAVADDYVGFIEAIKPRLLIAGTDLKFIMGAIPGLEQHFQVRVDEWTGHDTHDEAKSRKLLDWAEIIWCEWLLGNAVWYSRNKRGNKKLIIRLHLFELTRDFGRMIDVARVDTFVAVSVPTAEDMMHTFKYPRSKVLVVPNFVDVASYRPSDDPDRVFRLAMVGILPARKGYLKALQLLKALRDIDERYSLALTGRKPEELPWVYRDPEERTYYEACESYIRRHDLEPSVQFDGWVDTREYLGDKGFVLSLSEFESFHVAPAEAFASGNQAVFLPWRGVEFIYPKDYVFEDIYAIRDYILENRDRAVFEHNSSLGVRYVSANYSLERFVSVVHRLALEI